jgi:hypothetical protein
LFWWPSIARSCRAAESVLNWLRAIVLIMLVAWNLGSIARWGAHHDDCGTIARPVELGRLPRGHPVQGKLANGLALDNRIRPIFVGNGFGNYAIGSIATTCAIY